MPIPRKLMHRRKDRQKYEQKDRQKDGQTDPILKDPSGQGWGFNNFISIKVQPLLRAVFKMEAVMEWGVYFGPWLKDQSK